MRKNWTRALVAVLVVGGFMAPASSSGAAAESSWIVALVDGSDPSSEAPGMARRYGGRAGHIYEHAIRGFQFLGTEQAADSLSRNPRVRNVMPDGTVQAVLETLPTGVSRIDGPAAHAASYTGSGAVVAVLDSGIDLNHPDLAANLHSLLGKDCINNDSVADDDNGHGTHVAGTIAAVDNELGVIGVLHGARLVPVKVLNSSGSGSWSAVICGIDYVTANAGTIDVANMSLGGSGSATGCTDGGMHEAICRAVGAGVTFVAAAGNDAKNASGFVPAAYPEALTVSAFSDTNGNGTNAGCSGIGPWKTCDEVFASFSNYGAVVDIMAPGVNIYSTIIDGYGTKSGTSMAAPHVAGVAGLVAAANPGVTPAAVAAHLKGTGECPDGAGNGGDTTCGGQGLWSGDPDSTPEPLVDAASAALTALTGAAPAPSDTTNPTVALTNPADGAVVSGTVTVSATATDAGDGNGVAKVEFLVDGVLKTTDTASPYSWSWDTLASANAAHTVSARAYDPSGNTATASVSVAVDNPVPAISLSARGYKTKSTKSTDLTWSGATSASVDIYRNSAKLTTTANDGFHTDSISQKGGGSFTYKVCEATTTTCSNEATVTF